MSIPFEIELNYCIRPPYTDKINDEIIDFKQN